jgi:hypothetical protein
VTIREGESYDLQSQKNPGVNQCGVLEHRAVGTHSGVVGNTMDALVGAARPAFVTLFDLK